MAPQYELQIQGNFFAHPFAELVAEISQARLTGSLRVSEKERKCVVYFKNGLVVFAVSNARSARLFEKVLQMELLTKHGLSAIPNFANDLELSTYLQENALQTKQECDALFAAQIEDIVVDILTWTAGEWTFSSLARIRDGLAFAVNTPRMLVNYSRCLDVGIMLSRFRSFDESFRRSTVPEINLDLTPDEAFVLSRSNAGPLTATGLISVAAMAEAQALHAIYTLWLGGLLVRDDWKPAFTGETIGAMHNAKLELKTEAKLPGVPQTIEPEPEEIAVNVEAKEPEIAISIDEYLKRVEESETHYDILGVDTKAGVDELKQAYFALARMFHPDRYHSVGGETLRRIQNAFTLLAQAHETLKAPETREIYDYRMRKELAEREKFKADGNVGERNMQAVQAEENFERGYALLTDGKPEEALQFLARAAHFVPKTAKYRAFYGKALSADANQRHKAEAEMQAALKIQPNNPTFRLLLAEFFIQFNLLKRAEGELNRLLAIFPDNREARKMLEKLRA